MSYRKSGVAVSLKAPTTVLIKPDGKTLAAFGYEAENMYAKLAEADKHRGYYYFKLFKMMLYNKLVRTCSSSVYQTCTHCWIVCGFASKSTNTQACLKWSVQGQKAYLMAFEGWWLFNKRTCILTFKINICDHSKILTFKDCVYLSLKLTFGVILRY